MTFYSALSCGDTGVGITANNYQDQGTPYDNNKHKNKILHKHKQ